MKPGNTVLSSFGTTIFEVMSRLAQAHDAVNLGQGFPDGNGPKDVVEVGVEYLRNGVNQYPSMYGIPDLRTFFDGDVRWLQHYGFEPQLLPSLVRGR